MKRFDDLSPVQAAKAAGVSLETPRPSITIGAGSDLSARVYLDQVVTVADLNLEYGMLTEFCDKIVAALKSGKVSEVCILGLTTSAETLIRGQSRLLRSQGQRIRLAPTSVEDGSSLGSEFKYLSIVDINPED